MVQMLFSEIQQVPGPNSRKVGNPWLSWYDWKMVDWDVKYHHKQMSMKLNAGIHYKIGRFAIVYNCSVEMHSTFPVLSRLRWQHVLQLRKIKSSNQGGLICCCTCEKCRKLHRFHILYISCGCTSLRWLNILGKYGQLSVCLSGAMCSMMLFISTYLELCVLWCYKSLLILSYVFYDAINLCLSLAMCTMML